MNKVDLALFRRNPLFANFEEDTLVRLSSKMRITDVPKGTVLFFKGDQADKAYLLLRGKIAIFSLSSEGKKIVLNTLQEKDFFGELALLDSQMRTAGAEAETNCTIAVIDREKFLELSQGFNSEEWLSVVRYITGLLRKATTLVEDQTFLRADKRIAKKLIELTPEGKRDHFIYITQQELASNLGVSREVISRILSVMTKKGLISKEYRTIIVRDRQKLIKYTEG